MDYAELLKKARKSLPDLAARGERFETPTADVATGKQTALKNFSEIAKTLRREPKHLAKFLFKELAVPGSMNGAELILQGRISAPLINQRIEEYLREYVLCHECGKPDTALQRAERIEFLKCEACGARRSLHPV